MKRENGSPVHMMIPVRGWTTTPLQLTGFFAEDASDTFTTQQRLSTSFNSMLQQSKSTNILTAFKTLGNAEKAAH